MGCFPSTPYANNTYIQEEFRYYYPRNQTSTKRHYSSASTGVLLGFRSNYAPNFWSNDGDPRLKVILDPDMREDLAMKERYSFEPSESSEHHTINQRLAMVRDDVQIHGKKQIQVVKLGAETRTQTVARNHGNSPPASTENTSAAATGGPLPLSLIAARKTMAEISIPGMKAIFGMRAHLSRKAIWSIILVICTVISIVQVQDRVLYYLSTPVSVNVRVTRNESLKFPVLTLCNKNEHNVSALNVLKREKAQALRNEGIDVTEKEIADWDVPDLVGVRGFHAKELWDFTAHDINKMMIECWFGRNTTCTQIGRWKRIYTYMGVCFTLVINEPYVTLTGMFNNLYLKTEETESVTYKNDDGWKLLIHDDKESPIIAIRTHGGSLYRGWGKDVRVYTRSFQTLDTRNRPCIADLSYSVSKCIAKCFLDAAAQRVPCRLPFMDEVPGEYCNSPDDYRQTSNTVSNLLFYGAWSSNNCTCTRQCDQDIYVPYTETTQMENRLGKLRVFYQDLTFDDIEEVVDYGAIPLLCDIGGSVGLLLGASVLTFFEIIEAMFTALVVSMHKLYLHCAKR